MPNGLVCRVMQEYTDNELVMGGGTREVKKWRETGKHFEVKGNSAPFGVTGLHTPGGYALTSGIDADAWQAWYDQNKGQPLITEHLIYALPREDSAASRAKDQAEIISGLERIDPTKSIRIGNGMILTGKE